jgi:hypothetical protein
MISSWATCLVGEPECLHEKPSGPGHKFKKPETEILDHSAPSSPRGSRNSLDCLLVYEKDPRDRGISLRNLRLRFWIIQPPLLPEDPLVCRQCLLAC